LPNPPHDRKALLLELETEAASLREKVRRLQADDEPMSRRHLLRNLGTAAAAGVGIATGATALAPTPAAAATGAWNYGTNTRIDAAGDGSGLKSNSPGKTLVVENYGSGTAITAEAGSGPGIHTTRGVAARANPDPAGIFSEAAVNGVAVRARVDAGGTGVMASVGNVAAVPGPSAIQADAAAGYFGVYSDTATLPAVVGFSHGAPPTTENDISGIGVAGFGNVALDGTTNFDTGVPLRLSVGGSPTAGTFYRKGSFSLNLDRGLLLCLASGTPGTWVRVGFNPINPFRLVDTRNTGGPIGANSSRLFTLAPSGSAPNNVPAGTQGVSLNITVVDGTAPSYVTVAPSDYTWATPEAPYSNVNFGTGQIAANQTTVKVGPDGKIKVFNRHGQVNVVIDVLGFFS
jgi:hypothetical protein